MTPSACAVEKPALVSSCFELYAGPRLTADRADASVLEVFGDGRFGDASRDDLEPAFGDASGDDLEPGFGDASRDDLEPRLL